MSSTNQSGTVNQSNDPMEKNTLGAIIGRLQQMQLEHGDNIRVLLNHSQLGAVQFYAAITGVGSAYISLESE